MKVILENCNTCLQAPSQILLKVKKSSKVIAVLDFLSQNYFVPASAIKIFCNNVELTADTQTKILKAPNSISITTSFPEELFREAISALEYDSYDCFLQVLIKGCTQEWCLEKIIDSNGWGLIHFAASFGSINIMKCLWVPIKDQNINVQNTVKRNEKSINLVTKDGWTPLQLASYHGYEEIVKYLLEFKKIRINQLTKRGTALHCAVASQQAGVVRILLEQRASIKIEDHNQKTCIELPTTDEILQLIPQLAGQRIASKSLKLCKNDLVFTAFRVTEKFSRDYRCNVKLNLENGKFEEYLNSDENTHNQEITFKKKIIKFQSVQPCAIPVSDTKFYFKIVFPDIAINYWVENEELRDKITQKIKKVSDYCRWKGIGIRPVAANSELKIKKLNDYEPLCKKQQNVSLKEFEKICVLGSGSFGTVYLIRNIYTNELYALKSSERDKANCKGRMKYALTECEILKNLNSPFIVKLYWALVTPHHLHLVLEYCEGADLSKALALKGRLNETETCYVVASILLGLKYLHSRGIICRDLKPANILVDKAGYLKICDFGLAQNGVNGDKMNARLMGSPSYLSPEGIQNNKVGKKSDIWGLGIIAYQLLTGKLPFVGSNIEELYDMILEKKIEFPKEISQFSKEFLQFLLVKDPKLRPNAEEVQLHAFFRDIDWKLLSERKYEPPEFLLNS
ncbi:hypothetical protein SteCoe_29129 [Stentor coeruleus]|uniref:Protein kinase domain-containing protein n=1 Tax=Stentor coeruleus TaxID=5963 RepID=A0A1R2B6S8_9CILI|nr:hypothetical protein SteCoe_29129 [Stentor coeruleus]